MKNFVIFILHHTYSNGNINNYGADEEVSMHGIQTKR